MIRQIPPMSPPTAQVQGTGMRVCRDTVVMNHNVLFHLVEELGYRVAIETLEVHIEAFYRLCDVMIRSLYLNGTGIHG